MARPPIVGVPAFAQWEAGPSSRMCWPIRRRVNHRMSSGVLTSATHRATPPDSINDNTGQVPCPSARISAGDRGVVEGQPLVPHLLVGLVPLAGQDHDIARTRRGQHLGDCLPPVRLDEDSSARIAPTSRRRGSVDDRAGILVTWVVRRHDHDIGQAGRDLAHHRPLGTVAVTAAAEGHQHPTALGHCRRVGQHPLERVGVWA